MTTPHTDRLAAARVLVVGVGGLGAPAVEALVRSRIGTLGLIDPDVVELSNLHRQPLYDFPDVGRPKVVAAADRLRALSPSLRVEGWQESFTPGHVELAARYDVVLDGTDSIAAKFAVNDAAVTAGVPLVHAGVLGWRFQVLTVLPGITACYRCIFEEAPPPGDVPSCEEAGVLGPVPALAAALQVAEALHVLGGRPPTLAGRLLSADVERGRWRTIPVVPNPRCPACAMREPRRSHAS
jgi:adenylyltransferase/sulfurtransferase